MTTIENDYHVKPGDVRWVHGRKRVTVGERIGKTLTGSVFPTTEYQCTDDAGAECVVMFRDLFRLEDALPMAETYAPVTRRDADSATSVAAEWESALREMRSEVERREEAERGTLENAIPLMRDIDRHVMDFLPSDAIGYVIVGSTPQTPNLVAFGQEIRNQTLYGVYPNGKFNLSARMLDRYEDEILGSGHVFRPVRFDGLEINFDVRTGYTNKGQKPVGYSVKIDPNDD